VIASINHNLAISITASAILFGTPLLLAGLGELLAERSGVLNLGVEGMMLMGAVTAFWASQRLGGPEWLVLLIALVVAAVAGGLMALIHAFVTITLRANQIVSGLALTIFAGVIGLSSYLGVVAHLGSKAGRHQFTAINVFGLKNTPVVGPILFHENALVYGSWALVILVSLYLYRTRTGLYLRSVGESPQSADAMGINVTRYRYVHTVIGGLFAGVGGAYFTLALAGNWTDGITAGAGWIAIALVIFAFWRPDLLLVGAYLFGGFSSLGFDLQARRIHLPSEFYSALPFLMTVAALVAVSSGSVRRRLGTPAALGVPYVREES
jgi:simple sugar transport system permease protein